LAVRAPARYPLYAGYVNRAEKCRLITIGAVLSDIATSKYYSSLVPIAS
jgi:hypothetical protein